MPRLDSLPSSHAPSGRGRLRFVRWVVSGVAIAFSLCLVLFAAAWVAINAGVGSQRISSEAEAAIRQLYGDPVTVSLGRTRLSMASGLNLAFEVGDVDIRRVADGSPVSSARSIKIGIGTLALLHGEFHVTSLRINGAKAQGEAIQADDQPDEDPFAAVHGANGLIDPDRVLAFAFDSARDAFARLDTTGTRRIALVDTSISLNGMRIAIDKAELHRRAGADFTADGAITVAGTPVTFTAEGSESSDGAISRLSGKLETGAIDLVPDGGGPSLSLPRLSLDIDGSEEARGKGQKMRLHLAAPDLVAAIEQPGDLKGRFEVTADLAAGSGKIDLPTGFLLVNRTRIPFSGALGPKPVETPGEEAAWRYELVANDVFLAPLDSPEPGLRVGARIAGTVRPSSRAIEAQSLDIRTAGGEVLGSATVVFDDDKAPAVFLAIRSERIPVSHAKQLWPWLSAPNPRRWVMDNLFDGMLENTELELSAGPGRLTDGIPFDQDEIHGHFEVSGTRFDVAGEIPPVRDATGSIDFAGNDVTIRLAEGTGFMDNGRMVKGSNAVLTFKDTHINPVIGRLKIDIEGNAPSIIELASREPIEAGKRLGFSPDKLSGQVKGTVEADIPVDKETDVATLDWKVDLGFEDLSIDHEFDGQKLTGATGTAVIDPKEARIEARGKLNGIESTLTLVEPLAADGETSVDVAMVLDDKARAGLAPGLSGMVSGPVAVRVSGPNERRVIEASLDKAVLSIPWMGWSKGKGVPATARFVVETKGSQTRVRDLQIEGKTFAVKGDVDLSGGDLVTARLSRVKLNRDDDFSVRISRKNKALQIAVEGSSMDARALVESLREDTGSSSDGGGGTPISVSARLDRVIGFSDEVYSNLRLTYSGKGADSASASLTAVARSGSALEIRHDGGPSRSLDIRTGDAGAILRFLDIYDKMEGGRLGVTLEGTGNGPLSGRVDARDFWLVNEPRLASLVSTPAPGSNGRSLSDAVRRDIDTSRVKFDRGFAVITKGKNALSMKGGILRGPLIGTTFQGTLYDAKGRMSVTGTFMPAYGLNKIFGEIPVLGYVLGNGRDRGLIGITYKLSGNAKSPKLQVNPISAIAPGIFRSIFEFK